MDIVQSRSRSAVERSALVLLALPIAAFSLFVGYNKAFAPIEVLTEHLAWTIHLPVFLGKAIGGLELVAASVLLASLVVRALRRAGFYAAAWIVLNHGVAALVHIGAREWSTLTQSAVVIPLCMILAWLCWRRASVA
ncbi:MAG: hypothetical protein B7Y36_08915 [Novosphingobium sp. 28-62-57]|uniref:DoxX family protein n=1 Tax=unclassified Novosphingobium TaxID=2644732 RepID=UPI000BCFB299|nr:MULTISPECIES: DoxX family protein [unclassified Novosphingobium]OYW51276.1 MAG: hypothetical protein B7Z34_00215 [Novosphingobium sp. 12-62-10]OYZ10343.1 MAG: hypothetical protein B7Y36_08915 [Novosphingobium sp. 28-62-57]OZA37193.1 MAG: hypothetical protein B7X92_05115 [Novosphingobium sp. 17-62-9]HQS68061.1 DoxX family protein [Novosphingobium sp.]